jgi:hypothetical protein
MGGAARGPRQQASGRSGCGQNHVRCTPSSHAGDSFCHFSRQNQQRIECRGDVLVGVGGGESETLLDGYFELRSRNRKMASTRLLKFIYFFLSSRVNFNEQKR